MKKEQVSLSRRVLSTLLSLLLATQPLLPAVAATLTPTGTTQLDKAANGVPVVNIAPPNAAGISHNKYQDYNVGKEGLILNNATGKVNQTQLGGLIQANPNLKAGQEAAGIINEVTGTNRSQLQGYTEVAGKAANVIVANPYGITCNGCGFINTPNATLTTGKPVLDASGRLQSLDVSKGSILIEGQGLDGSQSDAVSIIARATDVNAQLHAKSLTVVAGANRVAADGSISPIPGEGDAPKVAVDTGALGGMYANRIRLVSSEKGVGVNLGNLNARDGDISLDASGKLMLKNSLASGSTRISGTNVTLTGEHKAGESLSVAGRDALTLNDARIVADQHLELSSSGRLTQNGGELTTGGNISTHSNSLSQSGGLSAAGRIALSASEDATLQGRVVAGQSVTVTSGSLSNSGTVAAGTLAAVTTGTLNNSGNVQGNELALTATDLTSTGTLNGTTALGIHATKTTLAGNAVSEGDVSVVSETLATKASSLLQGHNLNVNVHQVQLAGTQTASGRMNLTARDSLTHEGKTSASSLTVSAPTLTNSGVLTSSDLGLKGAQISNSGLLQGTKTLSLVATLLDNRSGGMIYAPAALSLAAQDLKNAGVITSDAAISLSGTRLLNSGELSGSSLNLDYTTLDNTAGGLLLAKGENRVSAQTLTNAGSMAGDSLTLNADRIDSRGLLQGDTSLSLTTGMLNLLTGSRTLTGGDLQFSATTLASAGQLQGQNVRLTLGDWQHDGSLLATGTLAASVAGQLTSTGDILSQGDVTLNAARADNRGSLLAAADVRLTGNSLVNSGTVQGNGVMLHADSISNSGTLTGVAALTLASRLEMAAPQLALTNSDTGSLLTAGDLTVSAGSINSAGQWQGKRILIDAQTLTNDGAIQAADVLDAQIRDALISTSGSKITANGELALSALTLSNSGQWGADRLTLRSDSLSNSGDIIGMSRLDVALTQLLDNHAGGAILSQNGLEMSAATLVNAGTVQGGGETHLQARTRVQNDGKILSGGQLTLSTPALTNSANGLVQALTLIMDVMNGVNAGRVHATGDAALRGATLTNSGTLQGANLLVDYRTLTNSATVLGTTSLTLNSDTLTNTDAGRLFSAGDLLLTSQTFSGQGQVVALGDATLRLINALTLSGTLAAGNTLAVSSRGDITNNSVMQGNGIALRAEGAFVNNGQLTTGSGSSTFSAQSLLLNGSGTLSAGGDVEMTSRSNLTVNGFTGAAGSLTMNVAGSLLNTALIYAGNNLSLLADNIHNLRGDILAGNSLWMQKDAAGNANSEIINTSGTIETQSGDIFISTAHLLNQREGLRSSRSEYDVPTIPGAGKKEWEIRIQDLTDKEVGVRSKKSGGITVYYYAPPADMLDKKVAWHRVQTDVYSDGAAARLSSGRDLNIHAEQLDNMASTLLAGRNATLTGKTLNNLSLMNEITTDYYVYSYKFRENNVATDTIASMNDNLGKTGVLAPVKPILTYLLVGQSTETLPGESLFRAIIQAVGEVSANFTNDIGNTATIAHAEGSSPTLNAPVLNTLTPFSTGSGLAVESLEEGDTSGISDPAGLSSIIDGLKNIAGGASLSGLNGNDGDVSAWPLPSGNNGYFVPSSDPKSPYLITLNPKLDGLGQLDPQLYGDLYALLGMNPGQAPRETGSQYTDKNQFLGSAYFLDRLGLTPDRDYRFLGDAAFDTRYVSNTLINQIGSRYINGLGSDLEQMRYLIESAAAQQQSLGLAFGVALTAAQIAALDQSLLWWESATINGQTVMIPKLYLSPKDVTVHTGSVISGSNVQLAGGSVMNSGSTILAQNGLAIDSSNSINNFNSGLISAAGGLNLSALGDINNISSSISGKTVGLESVTGSINNLTRVQKWDMGTGKLQLAGTDIGQTASITATDALAMLAGQDINITGANVAAGESLGMAAGNDINITANEISQSQGRSGFGRATIHSSSVTQQRSTLSAGDDITLLAGNDLNARAAAIAAEGDVGIQAGRDVNLLAEATSESTSSKAKKKTAIDESVRQQGTEIASGGNAVIIAGRDMNAQAAEVTAQGDIGVAAGRDVNLTTATESDYRYREKTKTSSGFLSKKTTHTINEDSATREKGSLLSGDNVTVSAGNNLLVQGSSVVGEGDVRLQAGNDVTVEAATDTSSYYNMKKTKKSGVFSSSSGFGVTVGSQSSKTTRKGAETTQSDARSLVGTTGGNVIVSAGNDVTLSAADMVAGRAVGDVSRATGHIDITGDNIAVLPGRDTVTESFKQETKSSGLTVSVKAPFEDTVRNVRDILSGDQGSSTVDKVKSLSAEAGALGMDGAGSMLSVSAGRSKSSSESHYQGEFNSGSNLSAAGNIQMTATGRQGDGNILVAGSQLTAGEVVILDAKRDISIITSTDSEARSSKSSSSGWSVSPDVTAGSTVRATSGGGQRGSQVLPGGMNQSKESRDGQQTTENASVIQGADIYLNSQEGSVDIRGSQLASHDDLMIAALKGNVSVTAGEDTSHQSSRGSSKTIGTLGGDGYSGTAGYSRDSYSNRDDASLGNGKRSQLSSAEGNIIVQAGQDLSLAGTDVAAGKSVSLSGENVLLDVSRDSREGQAESSHSQYGVTASAGGWAVDAAKTAEGAARSAEDGEDPRLTAIRTGQSGVSAAQGALSDSSVVKGKVSLTAGSSSQDSTYSSTRTQGTTISAGDAVSITAKKDIAGQGVQISGRQVRLDAGQDILLSASEDSQSRTSHNRGNQFAVGAGVSFIGAQNGISVELGASQQKGNASGNAQHHSNSLIRADEQLTVNSGRDTTLTGAELAGNRVELSTGRDLTLSSVQDTASYDSRQRTSGASLSLCIPPLCYGASSGSVNASGENITHRGKSVGEQSGIRAGSGGFDISVGNHTQLDGAVIASTAAAEKNRLDTATLGWTDIRNGSRTEGDSYTVALSGSSGGSNRNLAPAIGTGQAERTESGTTRSAISDGTLVIRNPEQQKQDPAGLSRDTDNAHQGVDVNGDVQKVRDDLAVQGEGMALAISGLDAYGKYAQQEAEASNAALAARLAAEGKLDGLSAAEQAAYVRSQPEYSSTEYGPGSDFWTRGTAAAGLLAGALGGNLKAGAAAGAAPLLASLVKEVGKDDAARAALHGLVAAALTQLKGGSGSEGMAAGAAGAVTASLITDRLVSALYNKDISELTADEKRLVSSLVAVAGAGAGYAAGGEVSLAAVGAETARVEVENNSLAHVLAAAEKEKPGTIAKYQAAREALCKQDPEACRQAVNEAASLGLDFVPVVGDIKGFHEAETALDYLAAAVGLIPGAGDVAGKSIKAAEKALKKGDVAEASRLINQASSEISAFNVAAYPKLKDDLIKQNLNNIAKQDPRLAAAVKGDNGKLNYGVGSGSKAEADELGKIWVGDGARPTSDGTGLMSADGTRVYRYPSAKDNSSHATTGVQANFETFKIDPVTRDKVKIGNGHMDIQ
ncbi:hemagglutinin repeat-containing protein [Leclercia tamurae]|uniref:Hemagglutinin repeat-containing protein n=1 Tax=Leclercia tamurae TaxID=2926467 RepID=A0ABT2RA04_9ENTR|nr:hemagglutinin repeat-containing protein [Leclercia tamurae]MCU6677675.1 hemagglutinin repeat-containing protein [Leclercia tamurae]